MLTRRYCRSPRHKPSSYRPLHASLFFTGVRIGIDAGRKGISQWAAALSLAAQAHVHLLLWEFSKRTERIESKNSTNPNSITYPQVNKNLELFGTRLAPILRSVQGSVKDYSIATGHVNLIQEQRFRLILDDGRSFLLSLGHEAAIDVRDLAQLKQKRARIQVVFSGEPNLASCIARAVRLLDTH